MAHKLPRGLYALIDDSVRPERALVEKAAAALQGGAPVLQVRLKHASDRDAVAWVREVVALARPRGARVIVNDRVDWALVAGADGVHLGQEDLPADLARSVLGPDALIGVTTRTLADIEAAQRLGADHVGLGPVFATSTKRLDHPPLGIEGLSAIARVSPLPVVAIAGITLGTIAEVARAGAWCAAVASDLLGADDPVSRARDLHRAFLAVT